jgi:hypothetical protein
MSDKNKQTTFSHKWIDDDNVEHMGTFTCKRLSVMDRSKLAVRRSQLSGGMYCVRDDEGNPTGQGIDPGADYINTMIAHLEQALVQKPIWFKFEDLTDMDLITEIYEKVIEFEMTFFRRGDRGAASESQSTASGEANSGQEHPVQGHPSAAAQVVGQEVQSALDA